MVPRNKDFTYELFTHAGEIPSITQCKCNSLGFLKAPK